jgi:pSer/pThr/pTyr-binding forkhead associated (FHA) protein
MAQRIRLWERDPTTSVGREIPVNNQEFVIGRGADCDLRLTDDDVSRHHCSIHSSGDEPLLLDLGSANGTFLNGQRIRSQSVLNSGDQISLGAHSYVVLLGDSEPPATSKLAPDPNRVTRRVPAHKPT